MGKMWAASLDRTETDHKHYLYRYIYIYIKIAHYIYYRAERFIFMLCVSVDDAGCQREGYLTAVNNKYSVTAKGNNVPH